MNNTFIIGIILIIINTIGQLLLKKASISKKDKIPILSLGYLLFFIAITVSYFLMKLIDLKYFTIIMSINYITVLFSSAYFFQESLSAYKLFGTIILIIGIFIFIGGR